MKKVLFVCVHNAGRSQMAEAFFSRLAEGKALALSAGTEPASRVNPVVVKVMSEVGIDVSHQEPKLLTLEMLKNVDRVITMGCSVEKACPASFVPTEDWELDDPEGKPIEEVRQIRDKTKTRVEELLEGIL